jgi:hypothetical protein
MAPTKAIAAYAVTTLILLTKGPIKVIGKISLAHVTARLTQRLANRSCRKKSALLHYCEKSTAGKCR